MLKLTAVVCLGLAVSALAIAAPATRAADPVTTQTIALVRHGEKPAAGLGQIDCQGLNRALALPAVLTRLFGWPAAVFAPNPATKVRDPGGVFDYIRPPATIEPTAIALGLPVDTSVGFTDIDGLQQRLGEPHLHDALVFVAWEHVRIVMTVRALLARHNGDAAAGRHGRTTTSTASMWSGSRFADVALGLIDRSSGQLARFGAGRPPHHKAGTQT